MEHSRGNVLPIQEEGPVDVSVICPFYNEATILQDAIETLLARLQNLEVNWELLVVNDGSTDGSAEIALEVARANPRLRVLGYRYNRGRGRALRTGIEQARGRIIVTTEIDLSWGIDIVERLYEAMEQNPDVDIVVASPHLPEGGYKNVPFKRVVLSRFGNWVIRACVSNAVTMNTGMTRAYRREVIRALPLDEDRKEFHLEVVLKAQAFQHRFLEIPAVLEWKDYKHKGQRVKRKSSSKVNRLVVTHSLFSLFANPIRYVWGISALSLLLSAGFLVWSVVRLILGLVSVYTAILSLGLATVALLLFAFGVIAQQGHMIQVEIWKLKRDFALAREASTPRPSTGPMAEVPPRSERQSRRAADG
jgi:dolichol-phosphate mannosyltransferase